MGTDCRGLIEQELQGGGAENTDSGMKCSNAGCNHGIGLVSYRRGWCDKQRFCSKRCRDGFSVETPEPTIKNATVADKRNYYCPCGKR